MLIFRLSQRRQHQDIAKTKGQYFNTLPEAYAATAKLKATYPNEIISLELFNPYRVVLHTLDQKGG